MHRPSFTVYVLRSLKDGKLYVGMTQDLEERLRAHQAGRVPSTKHRRPLVLLHSESCATRSGAREREQYFKSGPGHKALAAILAEKRKEADASR